MAGIYNEEKMKQKPVYPTRETAQYSDWALFNMGKELETVVDSLEPGAGYQGVDPINVDHEHQTISLKMGAGVGLDSEGNLTAEGGEGHTYEGVAPIVVDNDDNQIGINIGAGLEVDNNTLKLDIDTGNGLNYGFDMLYLVPQDPIKVESSGIGVKVGSGLNVNLTDGKLVLDPTCADGIRYEKATNPPQFELEVQNPIKVDSNGIGIKEGDNLTINSDGELDVELHCGLGLRWDNTKTDYSEDTLRLRLDSVIGSNGAIRVTSGIYPDQIDLDVIRYNTQAFWDGESYDSNNIFSSGIIKKNVDSKVSKAGVQSPLSINANDELVLGVGSGLELDTTGTQLKARLGTGLQFDGTNHIAVDNKLQYEYAYKIVNGLQMFGLTEFTVTANRTYELTCTRGAIISLLPSGWEPVENAPFAVSSINTSFVIIGTGGLVTSTGVDMFMRNVDSSNKTINLLNFTILCRKAL